MFKSALRKSCVVVGKFQRKLPGSRVDAHSIGSRQRIKKLARRVPHEHRILRVEMLIIEDHGDKALRQRGRYRFRCGWIGGQHPASAVVAVATTCDSGVSTLNVEIVCGLRLSVS